MSNVIEIKHLYKEYRLGLIGYGTLREDLQSWWARARGKEDPNSILFSGDQSGDGKSPDHILALNDLNLTVERGERLGIIGKNGAGKTTLLKILSRIASPTKGTARIKGRVASLLAVGTGFHKELTGRENIYLNGSILGLRRFEIDQRFDEIVDFSGVEQFIDTPVKRYSSGMYVRLGFSVAAHLDPEVLIVDEVLAVGDAEFREKALGKMKDVSEDQGRTILFVSHNMEAINNLCERAILLDSGRIIKDDEAKKVVTRYLSSAQVSSIIETKTMLASSEFNRPTGRLLDGSARFTDFDILNEKGEKCEYFNRGEIAYFYFKYRVYEHIDCLRLTTAVGDKSRDIAYSIFSHYVSDTSLPAGYNGEFNLIIDTNGFLCGEFPLNFLLHIDEMTILSKTACDFLPKFSTPPLRVVNDDVINLPKNTDFLFHINSELEFL
jgi:lipopolysaccharide transport system ATP-binding protein